jgi:hypothetical protein
METGFATPKTPISSIDAGGRNVAPSAVASEPIACVTQVSGSALSVMLAMLKQC